MVAVKHTAGMSDINALLLFGDPGKFEQEIEVIPDNRAFVILAASRLKFLQLG